MTAPEPKLLDFPFTVELASRFSDLDTQKHINNVAIANLYQESRLQFHREIFRDLRRDGSLVEGLGKVLAEIRITYRRESHYPYPVSIGCGVSRLGNTSYTIASAMFQKDVFVGSCDAVLVYVKDGKPYPVPDGAREVLERYQMSGSESP
ncbi:acyl-CoA thioesterase [Gilvimarinus sp. F26214L]|uniref:acyl-CoA thioesterase n=1 Tax=Gilvimarinus sp. DZF01 TaxID=3461371 RepID=UPI004045CA51